MEEFPNASQRAKQNPTEVTPEVENQIEKIISGKATVRKPSGFKRFRQSFIVGDASTVGEHVFWNMLIPSAKDAILEMGNTFLEMMILGDRRTSGRFFNPHAPTTVSRSTSTFNYGGLSAGGGVASSSVAPNVLQPTPRPYSPNEITVPTLSEANAIISKMAELLEQYKVVTVANLYAMIGVSSVYTDSRWGWTNLQDAGVKRKGGAVMLLLPPPEDLGI